MPSIKMSGTTVSFRLRNRISNEAPTAQRIYKGISSLTRLLVSSKIADIPPMKQSLFKMFLICFCAFIVLASALGASN